MSNGHNFQPKLIGIICNWCCYGGADLCGVSRFQYPPHIRLVRVMCSARVDMLHILRAYSNGVDGIFVGGCHLCDCHYVTHGNFNAYGMVYVFRKILENIGIFPQRLRLEWVSAGEGIRFANFMNEYSAEVTKLGPLGKAEGIDSKMLSLKLDAVKKVVPYIKLVLTRKFHISQKTEDACYSFYKSGEFERLYKELIESKINASLMLAILKNKSLSGGEISEILGISPAEVAKQLKASAKQGLAKYDFNKKCYTLA